MRTGQTTSPSGREPSVLVHHGNPRNAQLIASDLGRRGVRVELVGDSRWTAARFSRFVSRFHLAPPLVEAPEEFVDTVCRLCRERELDLFLPSSHEVFALARFQDRLRRETRYPFCSEDVIAKVDDKARISQIARAAGLAVPRYVQVSEEEELELPPGFFFPLIYKPVVAAASKGFGIASTAAELKRALANRREIAGGAWLVQEMLRGPLIVWSGIFTQGVLRVSFHFETLRTHPATGGTSVLRQSVRVDSLDAEVVRLLSAVGYEGFCTLDFMHAPRTGALVFTDFNPRFGTSLHAALAAGVSFPWRLLQLARGEELPQPDYARGVQSISLLGHLRRLAGRGSQGPSRIRLAADLLSCLWRLRAVEEFEASDPVPFLMLPVCEAARGLRSRKRAGAAARRSDASEGAAR